MTEVDQFLQTELTGANDLLARVQADEAKLKQHIARIQQALGTGAPLELTPPAADAAQAFQQGEVQ